MQKMRVQMPYAAGQFARKYERLPKSPDSAGREIATEIVQPDSTDIAIGRPAPHFQPGTQHAKRPAMKILGKVKYRRPDFSMHRMGPCIGRQPKGNNQDIQPAALQGQNLLGDECLR